MYNAQGLRLSEQCLSEQCLSEYCLSEQCHVPLLVLCCVSQHLSTVFVAVSQVKFSTSGQFSDIYLTASVDITDAKRKYYGCFSSNLFVCGKSRNELASLHLVKSYCLPRLLHGCESMLLNTIQTRELDIIWNNDNDNNNNPCFLVTNTRSNHNQSYNAITSCHAGQH